MFIKRKNFKHVGIFTSLAAFFLSCSDQSKQLNQAAKSADTLNYDGSSNRLDNKSNSFLEQVQRDTMDNTVSFEALLEAERDERIKEDKRINERIDLLEGNLSKLAALVDSEIRRLDAKDKEIEERLVQETSRLDTALQGAITTLRTETDTKVAALKDEQDKARTDYEAKLTKLVQDSAAAAKLRQDELQADLLNVKAQIEKDKNDLTMRINLSVSAVQEAMAASAEVLNDKINALDTQTKEQFNTLMKNQESTEANMRNALSQVKTDLQNELQQNVSVLDKKLTDESASLNKKYSDLAAVQDKENAARKAEIEDVYKKLSTQIAAQQSSLTVDFDLKLKRLELSQDAARQSLETQLKALIDRSAQQSEERSAQLEKDLQALSARMDQQKAELSQQMSSQIQQVTELVSLSNDMLQEQITSLDAATTQRLDNLLAGQTRTAENMRTALANLKTSLEGELDSKITQLETSQKISTAMLNAQYSALEQRQKQDVELQKSQLAKVASDLEAQLATQKDQLQKQMSDDNKVLTDLLTRSLSSIEAKLAASDLATAAKIMQLAEEQTAFRDFVVNNYASKTELKLVQDYAEGVMAVTNVLGKRIDQNDAETRKLLSDSIIQLQAETDEKISQVQATIAGLQNEMQSHVASYEAKIQGLSEKALSEVQDLRQRMIVMRGDLTGQQAQLRDQMLAAMSKQAAEFEFAAQASKQAIADQLLKIDARIDKTDANLVRAKEDVQRSLNVAIAKEQAERAKIQDSLQGLASELESVAQMAQRTQALANANQEAIRALRSDFETEKASTAERFKVAKADLDQNVAALRDEIKAGLDRVAAQASAMVANLGEDVQEQFKTTAVELAQLNQRQVAALAATNQQIAAINTNRDSQAEFEKAIITPREQTIKALVDLIGAISEVETAFVASLNPNQNAPGFYNQSFKPIMAKCDGNPQASFANALGYDSFQFLAQEYVRQLMFSARGMGADPIFHGVPTIMPIDNLGRLSAMAATRYTVSSATDSCVQDVQNWAKQILYAADANSVALRQGLAADQNLARSVLKLRNVATTFATPVAQVEQLIVKAMKGQLTIEQLYVGGAQGQAAVLPRYALTLLESTQNALLLKEREQTFDRISSVQESFAKDNAEVRKLIDANKAGLVRDLEAFKVSNDQRLTTMNTKLTALDTSMKKALDVMMTLAARAGYADVQAAVLEAAQPLNYIPQTIPEVRPAITEIQHFFLAPSLANNTDACTGATAMSGAGVRTYYQHGGWGVCWVNFRNYPLGEWFGRANNMFYRVFGAASEIRMDTQGFTKSFRIAGQPSAGATIKAGKPTQGVFDLSGDGVLTWYLNYNRSWDGVVINFTALSDSGKPSVTSGYRVQLYSPLVLDFVSVGMPRSISENDSEAGLDLQGNG